MEQGPERKPAHETFQELLTQKFEELQTVMAKIESMVGGGKTSDPTYFEALKDAQAIAARVSQLCENIIITHPEGPIEEINR